MRIYAIYEWPILAYVFLLQYCCYNITLVQIRSSSAFFLPLFYHHAYNELYYVSLLHMYYMYIVQFVHNKKKRPRIKVKQKKGDPRHGFVLSFFCTRVQSAIQQTMGPKKFGVKFNKTNSTLKNQNFGETVVTG